MPNSTPRGRLVRRLLLLAVVGTVVGGWYGLLPADAGSWDALQRGRDEWRAFVDERPVTSRLAYFLLYVSAAALALPITPALSVLGGWLFGLLEALLLVSFASTAGASLAFLLSRYLLAGWVQRRWGARLEPLQRGLDRDGAFYLLALRLSPLISFTLVNLGMGLTRLPLRTFWWVSQLGMLPVTFVFVNAGAAAGWVRTPADILSRELLAALTLAALAPLALRWLWKRTFGRRSGALEPPADEGK
jgi:uncharacterized membrane protein YdjX (TVP38/TMEM64 family)